MIKILLDANLSPTTAIFLRNLGTNTRSITEEELGYLKDAEIVELAKKEKRIIVTFDLDFGEIYHAKEAGKVGMIVLRIKNQTPENVNDVLKNFLGDYLNKLSKDPTGLILIKENYVRFVKAKQ